MDDQQEPKRPADALSFVASERCGDSRERAAAVFSPDERAPAFPARKSSTAGLQCQHRPFSRRHAPPRSPGGVQLLVTLQTTGSNYVSNGKLSGAATPVLPLSEVVHMKATFPPRHLGGFEASTEVSRGNARAVAALYPPGEEVDRKSTRLDSSH